MLSRNPLEALQYEAILRAQADQEIREEAVQRAGVEKGELIGKIEFAQRMLREPVTAKSELQACSVQELQTRLAALEARAFPAD
jgi:hypothetical protein